MKLLGGFFITFVTMTAFYLFGWISFTDVSVNVYESVAIASIVYFVVASLGGLVSGLIGGAVGGFVGGVLSRDKDVAPGCAAISLVLVAWSTYIYILLNLSNHFAFFPEFTLGSAIAFVVIDGSLTLLFNR